MKSATVFLFSAAPGRIIRGGMHCSRARARSRVSKSRGLRSKTSLPVLWSLYTAGFDAQKLKRWKMTRTYNRVSSPLQRKGQGNAVRSQLISRGAILPTSYFLSTRIMTCTSLQTFLRTSRNSTVSPLSLHPPFSLFYRKMQHNYRRVVHKSVRLKLPSLVTPKLRVTVKSVIYETIIILYEYCMFSRRTFYDECTFDCE